MLVSVFIHKRDYNTISLSQNLDTSNKKKKSDDDEDEDLDEKLKKMGTSVMDVGCTLDDCNTDL